MLLGTDADHVRGRGDEFAGHGIDHIDGRVGENGARTKSGDLPDRWGIADRMGSLVDSGLMGLPPGHGPLNNSWFKKNSFDERRL